MPSGGRNAEVTITTTLAKRCAKTNLAAPFETAKLRIVSALPSEHTFGTLRISAIVNTQIGSS